MSSILLPILLVALPLLAEGRYIYSILKGKTKPSFVAFLIFTMEMSIVFAASYALGARDSLFVIGTFTVLHFVTMLLALRYGYVIFSKFNIVCIAFSVLGLILWWFTENPWYALLIEITVDTIGYIVLTRKLYRYPSTEDRFAWGIGAIAYGLNLVVISHWIPEEYLFSLLNVLWCSIVVALSFHRPKLHTT